MQTHVHQGYVKRAAAGHSKQPRATRDNISQTWSRIPTYSYIPRKRTPPSLIAGANIHALLGKQIFAFADWILRGNGERTGASKHCWLVMHSTPPSFHFMMFAILITGQHMHILVAERMWAVSPIPRRSARWAVGLDTTLHRSTLLCCVLNARRANGHAASRKTSRKPTEYMGAE